MAYDEELADRIRAEVAGEKNLTEMKMFGGLAFLIGGHMAVAASGQGGLMLRCDPDDTDALLQEPGAQEFEMRGKGMRGWLRVDAGDGRRRRRTADLGRARGGLRPFAAAQVAPVRQVRGCLGSRSTGPSSCCTTVVNSQARNVASASRRR